MKRCHPDNHEMHVARKTIYKRFLFKPGSIKKIAKQEIISRRVVLKSSATSLKWKELGAIPDAI